MLFKLYAYIHIYCSFNIYFLLLRTLLINNYLSSFNDKFLFVFNICYQRFIIFNFIFSMYRLTWNVEQIRFMSKAVCSTLWKQFNTRWKMAKYHSINSVYCFGLPTLRIFLPCRPAQEIRTMQNRRSKVVGAIRA